MKHKTSNNTNIDSQQTLPTKSQPPTSPAQQAYIRNLKHRKTRIRVLQILILVGFLLLWEVAAYQNWINSFIFCSPSKLYETFVSMMQDGSLLHHINITLYETLVGFSIVIFGSLLVAVVFWWNETISKVLELSLIHI